MARKFRRNGHFTRRVAAASKSTFNREILIDLQFAIVSTAYVVPKYDGQNSWLLLRVIDRHWF